jgi:hypothetical protein
MGIIEKIAIWVIAGAFIAAAVVFVVDIMRPLDRDGFYE